MAAVQEHLLPSEPGIPGARDVHAVDHLRLVLQDPRLDPADRDMVRAGLVDLRALCQELYARPFEKLTAEQRERALRRLEAAPGGHRWLHEILEFLLEALLGDPSYGGNPGGIGWSWLQVDPGFPRPAGGKAPRT